LLIGKKSIVIFVEMEQGRFVERKLSEIINKICREKHWQRQELAKILDVSPATLSRIDSRDWSEHWRVFKKIAAELDPLAIFDEPLDAERTWHYLVLKTHLDLPEDQRNPMWRKLNDLATRIAEEEAAGDNDHTKKIKPSRTRKIKT
jgi:transcriptional regulator with XRE-family HTH domain